MSNTVDLIISFPYFGVLITVAAFYLGQRAYIASNRKAYLQPVVFGMVIVISLVLLLDVPFQVYYESSYLLSAMLGPATVALAIPLFQNARRIRELILPILCTVIVGSIFTVGVAVAIVWAMGGSELTILSMPTKSITTPIAMIVTEDIGGIAALSAMCVLLTGALGAMVGIPIMNRLGIKDAGIKGFTLGLTSHALGTARALEEGEECGAFSALAMGITGVMTALVLPFVVLFFT
ncbi:LrgB family protein [Ketobacter sp. MCCC 1A13808]|uniref:LrgB family protein n=1 Tax=Ketobacter sp. MCCC 1A13808 TaxID=2602738 RepID=UPI000F271A88|nr:LrgB family protein [Ketobacter sp. MCCC 1A13808]MVF14939.1 LrgB family protein [Ketobacter sp. MCCC 1A13808]RLP55944.1 MAG: LrgB family protein [Ketobacter sp.]